MSQPPISVVVDDRIRLMAAILTITDWSEREQAEKPHGTHAHAKATQQALASLSGHPAVITMQDSLNQGYSLNTIFSYVTCLSWPGLAVEGDIPDWSTASWASQLGDFWAVSPLNDLWERDRRDWDDAAAQATRALLRGDPSAFLARLFGTFHLDLSFQPNLVLPSSRTICFKWDKQLVCICPPRIAWGNNPPWPYDDDPTATYSEALNAYVRILLKFYFTEFADEASIFQSEQLPVSEQFRQKYPGWFDQIATLLGSGATAIFLEEVFGEREAASYIVMQSRAHGLKILPDIVAGLKAYFSGIEAGQYRQLVEYLPALRDILFAGQQT